MATESTIYIAVDPADEGIADVLQAYLQAYDLPIVRSPQRSSNNTIYGLMCEAAVIVVVDSDAFRDCAYNWELHYAQDLHKPLVVVSLSQAVDETRSTAQVRLLDFTAPARRKWRTLIEIIVQLAKPSS